MPSMATNGELEEIKAPQGVVLPPREIKGERYPSLRPQNSANIDAAILEKTAGYVARNGIVFEGMHLPSR